jgi:tetratricopeptide (TPR) repeat protein
VSKRERAARRGTAPSRAAQRDAATRSRDGWSLLWICVALVAVNLAVFGAVRGFAFVNWDDPTYILENRNVLKGLTSETIRWAITTGSSPYWHPVTWLSHLLDVSLFGLDAGPHHVVNLALHIANTLLIFGLFSSMTGSRGPSAFVAAVFAVHPLHVESVAWIAERKDVLSTLFWALTIAAYVSWTKRQGIVRYLLVMVLFLLALMSKPMVVTLPVVLLLLDVWPLRRTGWTALLAEKVALFVMAALASLATVLIQNRVGAMATLDALPWYVRISNAITGYVAYVWMTLWPANLAAFYPLHPAPVWKVAAAALILATVTGVACRYRRTHPYGIVGWLWYVVTLSPVIGFLQAGEQARADRFMYVPMIGLLIVAAWGFPDLVASVGERTRARNLLAALSLAIVFTCAVAAHAQVQTWQSSVTLWRHAIQATPDSYIAYENLAQALRERGELDDALALYARALPLAPAGSPGYEAVIHNSMGLAYTQKGNTAEAIAHFTDAVRLNPRFVEPQINLANALAASGRAVEAIPHYRRAVELKPDLTEAHVGLGGALLSQEQPAEAIAHYLEALRLDVNLPQAHNGLGAALSAAGRDDEAMPHYLEALRLKPDLTSAHFNVALVFVKQGKLPEAKRELNAALAIDPGYAAARQLLERIEAIGG